MKKSGVKQEVRESRISHSEESSGRPGSKRALIGRLKELNPEQLGEVVELILSLNPEVIYKRE